MKTNKLKEAVQDLKVMFFAAVFLSNCAFWSLTYDFSFDYMVKHFGPYCTTGLIMGSLLILGGLYSLCIPKNNR
jgi:hypothetical protein